MYPLGLEDIRRRLLDYQSYLEEDDTAFAERLRVPRSTWTAIRRGTRPLSGPALVGALNAFPRLYRSMQGQTAKEEELDNRAQSANNTGKPASGRTGRR